MQHIPIRVMAFGTFDYIHEGHRFFLSEAAKLGDELIVIVARDKNVLKNKGSLPHFGEQRRFADIRKLNIAAKVRLGYLRDTLKILHILKPDIIALGFDQNAPIEEINRILPKVKIHRLSSHFPQRFKSSILKNKFLK